MVRLYGAVAAMQCIVVYPPVQKKKKVQPGYKTAGIQKTSFFLTFLIKHVVIAAIAMICEPGRA